MRDAEATLRGQRWLVTATPTREPASTSPPGTLAVERYRDGDGRLAPSRASSARSAGSAASSRSRATPSARWSRSTDGVGTKILIAARLGRYDGVGARPRQPLRQRHPGRQRDAAVLPRLSRRRQARSGRRGRCRCRRPRRLPRARHGAARRRDGRDAWALSAPTTSTSPARSSASSTLRRCPSANRVADRAMRSSACRRSGLHTNGYTPRACADRRVGVRAQCATPTRCSRQHPSYYRAVRAIQAVADVKAMAHITGGGLLDNVPRTLPGQRCKAIFEQSRWSVPPIMAELVERAEPRARGALPHAQHGHRLHADRPDQRRRERRSRRSRTRRSSAGSRHARTATLRSSFTLPATRVERDLDPRRRQPPGAALDDERFAPRPIHHAIERWDRDGIRVERFHDAARRTCSRWIDAEFGGVVVERGVRWRDVARDATAAVRSGFATFDPRGLRFAVAARVARAAGGRASSARSASRRRARGRGLGSAAPARGAGLAARARLSRRADPRRRRRTADRDITNARRARASPTRSTSQRSLAAAARRSSLRATARTSRPSSSARAQGRAPARRRPRSSATVPQAGALDARAATSASPRGRRVGSRDDRRAPRTMRVVLEAVAATEPRARAAARLDASCSRRSSSRGSRSRSTSTPRSSRSTRARDTVTMPDGTHDSRAARRPRRRRSVRARDPLGRRDRPSARRRVDRGEVLRARAAAARRAPRARRVRRPACTRSSGRVVAAAIRRWSFERPT